MYQHLRTEQGFGTLEAEGREPLLVKYTIDISVSVLGHGVRGMGRVEGNVIAEEPFALNIFMGGGPEATLVLQDGRRWECNLQSSAGRLTNRGNPPFSFE